VGQWDKWDKPILDFGSRILDFGLLFASFRAIYGQIQQSAPPAPGAPPVPPVQWRTLRKKEGRKLPTPEKFIFYSTHAVFAQ
jgi:hypothetical protein